MEEDRLRQEGLEWGQKLCLLGQEGLEWGQ